MSSPKRKDGIVSFDELVKGVEKDEVQPYRIQLEIDTIIEIQEPSGDALLDAEEAAQAGQSRKYLQAVCGDQYKALIEIVGPKSHRVLTKLAEDIQGHFRLGGSEA